MTITLTFSPSRVTAGSVLVAANSARRCWLSVMRCSKLAWSGRVGRMMTLPLSPSTRIVSPSSTLWRMSFEPADDRHADGPGDDRHVRGQRAFLEQHGLQPPPVIFEQFGGPEVAGDQHGIVGQPGLRRGAHPARDDAQQPVRQILEVVHPLLQQRVVDFAHPRAHPLLDALDRRFGGQAAVDRLVDPPRPALVVGEHAVGLEDLLMLAGGPELGLARHVVDLLAHPAEAP